MGFLAVAHLQSVKRKEQRHKKARREASPVTMLTDELDAVRRDLRRTIRAYAARLELDLAESALLRHDWIHRWKRIFEIAGVRPPQGMPARETRLKELAEHARVVEYGR